MQTNLLLMCSDFLFDTRRSWRCVVDDTAMPSCAATGRATHARPRKTGAEKSRDMTIYGECGADGPRRPRGACPLSHRYFSPFKPALKPFSPSCLSFFHHLHLAPQNFSFYGSLSIPSHPRTLSYRPPTGHDMPCTTKRSHYMS